MSLIAAQMNNTSNKKDNEETFTIKSYSVSDAQEGAALLNLVLRIERPGPNAGQLHSFAL